MLELIAWFRIPRQPQIVNLIRSREIELKFSEIGICCVQCGAMKSNTIRKQILKNSPFIVLQSRLVIEYLHISTKVGRIVHFRIYRFYFHFVVHFLRQDQRVRVRDEELILFLLVGFARTMRHSCVLKIILAPDLYKTEFVVRMSLNLRFEFPRKICFTLGFFE